MTTLTIIGTQWGDEGKGKITDYLAEDADVIVRFQGGTNAGHTIEFEDEVFKLHLLPSGILREGKRAVIANGVVVDAEEIMEEIRQVEGSGRSVEGLRISDRAHLILDYHRVLDGAEERQRGDKGVGTTGRGIGPCYSDKIARHGFRMGELAELELLRDKADMVMPIKRRLMEALGADYAGDADTLLSKLREHQENLGKYVCDTSVLINEAIAEGKRVLFEGAQGMMLDIDHGTYPYVTSSNTVAGGVCTGAGVPPSAIHRVVGVLKAYTTRVGAGPFPTELTGELGDHLMHKGGEYGTTTGRARRCGWLDLVVARHAIRLSGITDLAITKLDVLNGLETVKVATAYEIDGEEVRHFPASLTRLERARPILTELPGWKDWGEEEAMTIAERGCDALPENMRAYISFMEKQLGVPASIISIGKDRLETIDLMKEKW